MEVERSTQGSGPDALGPDSSLPLAEWPWHLLSILVPNSMSIAEPVGGVNGRHLEQRLARHRRLSVVLLLLLCLSPELPVAVSGLKPRLVWPQSPSSPTGPCLGSPLPLARGPPGPRACCAQGCGSAKRGMVRAGGSSRAWPAARGLAGAWGFVFPSLHLPLPWVGVPRQGF